jgi:hypothetical protein
MLSETLSLNQRSPEEGGTIPGHMPATRGLTSAYSALMPGNDSQRMLLITFFAVSCFVFMMLLTAVNSRLAFCMLS